MTRRRGMTVVEVLMALAIFGLVFGLVVRNMRFATLATDSVDKLESLQNLRLAQRKVQRLIETSTQVMAPAPGQESTVLALADRVHGLHLVFLDPDGKLRWMPRGEEAEVLAEGVLSFRVQQPFRHQVEARIEAAGGGGVPLSMLISGYTGNHYHIGGN